MQVGLLCQPNEHTVLGILATLAVSYQNGFFGLAHSPVTVKWVGK